MGATGESARPDQDQIADFHRWRERRRTLYRGIFLVASAGAAVAIIIAIASALLSDEESANYLPQQTVQNRTCLSDAGALLSSLANSLAALGTATDPGSVSSDFNPSRNAALTSGFKARYAEHPKVVQELSLQFDAVVGELRNGPSAVSAALDRSTVAMTQACNAAFPRS